MQKLPRKKHVEVKYSPGSIFSLLMIDRLLLLSPAVSLHPQSHDVMILECNPILKYCFRKNIHKIIMI